MNKETLTVETDKYGTITYCNADGKFHNPNGPAIVFADGRQEYWINGQRHKENGPAVVYADGSKSYYINGKLHNADGPAVVWDGDRYWHINDTRLSEAQFKAGFVKQSAPLHNKTATIDGVEYTLTAK